MGKEKGVSEGRMKKEGGTAGGKNEEKDIDYQSMVGIAIHFMDIYCLLE